MTSEQKRTFWTGHFEAWQKSNLTQPKYCEQHSLKLATFSYWRTRLGKNSAEGKKLIPVNIGSPGTIIGIVLPNGIRLDVPTSALADVLLLVCRTTQKVN